MEYKDSDSFDDFDSETNLTPFTPVAARTQPLLKPLLRAHPRNRTKIRIICVVNFMKLEKKMFLSRFEMQVSSGPRCLSMENKDSDTLDDFDFDSNLTTHIPVAARAQAPF